eukprot:3667546-Amphidinium_carterae.1
MRFQNKGNMQYTTEVQFELLRKALWTSAIDLVQAYDATFWRDAIRNGFDKYLQRIHTTIHSRAMHRSPLRMT